MRQTHESHEKFAAKLSKVNETLLDHLAKSDSTIKTLNDRLAKAESVFATSSLIDNEYRLCLYEFSAGP
jgi:hypothetical protein